MRELGAIAHAYLVAVEIGAVTRVRAVITRVLVRKSRK